MLMMLMGSLQVFAANNKNPDETVLINQTSVQDAGGFPFKITAPGSYKLTGNLVVPVGTDGIQIQALDVTLDLNGFSITGGITCDLSGVTCTPGATAETLGVNPFVFGTTMK